MRIETIPKKTMTRWSLRACISVLMSMACLSGASGDEMVGSENLANLSLEELLSTEITTLSRKAESLASAPAAVHVITRSDIRRSGARSIPELLRMVPGMQVAQLDGNKWAVTSRGANGRFAPKLLVLMDGRTLYNPVLSGVQWDAQDTDVSAIERIEVIRGPGATMWGSNAVNGIVNIITQHAADTQGGNIEALGGRQGHETVVRYGSSIGDSAWRLYGKYFDRDGNVDLLGADTEDYSEMARFGGRYDWDGDDTTELTLTLEVYDGESGEYRLARSLAPPYESLVDAYTDVSGGFAMGHWSKQLDDESAIEIRAYFDTHARDLLTYTEDIETIDVDVQHSFAVGGKHEWIWGLSYRSSSDETTGTFEVEILPFNATRDRISAFVQDEISLLDGRARLMLGSKFERNELTDEHIEIEPSVRMSYNVSENRAIWASISQAVRMPSRGEQGGRAVSSIVPPGADPTMPLPVPAAIVVRGNPNMVSEDVTAYEAGYRMRDRDFQLDVAVFYNVFTNLRSLSLGAPECQPSGVIVQFDPTCLFVSPYVEVPLNIGNDANHDAMGAEVWISKQITERWRLQGGYTYFHATDTALGSQGEALAAPEDSPDHQISLRSSTDINENLELDVLMRWVDDLEIQQIDAYTALDFRFAWSPTPALSLAAVGRNLFSGDHLEFMSELVDLAPVQIETGAFIELRWIF